MNRWTILAALSLIRFSFGYQFQSMAALAPAVARELGIDQAAAGGLIGLYWAPGVLVAMPGGWLGRRFGDKPMVLAGGLLTVLGGLFCGFGDSYAALAAGRLIAGLGAIVMSIMAVKMATDWFAGREIGLALGCLFGSFPLGIALGLAIQVPLAWAIGWRPVMLTTAALAAAVVAAIALFYRAPPSLAGQPAAGSTEGRALLSGAEIALLSIAGIGLALYNGSFLIYVSYAPALLVSNGFGVAEAGLVLAAASALSTFALPLGGHLADRSGRPRAVLFLGAAAFAVCVALLPPLAASHSLLAVTVLAILISTLGSMPVSPMVALPAEALRPDRRAIGLGLFYTWFYLGTAVCPPLGGWLYDLAGTPAAPIYLNAGLGIATIVLYALFVGLARIRRVQ
jgi:predicted MFS family arabinose efflux permease